MSMLLFRVREGFGELLDQLVERFTDAWGVQNLMEEFHFHVLVAIGRTVLEQHAHRFLYGVVTHLRDLGRVNVFHIEVHFV